MRALLVASLLLGSVGVSRADAPSLTTTLDWIAAKLRDRGRFEATSPRSGTRSTAEQAVKWYTDGCVMIYTRSVTLTNREGRTWTTVSNWRVPLAEMNPASASLTFDTCTPQKESEESCQLIELTAINNKDVVSVDGPYGGRGPKLTIKLRAAEGELAAKMRDALKHAANLCAAKDPEFPK